MSIRIGIGIKPSVTALPFVWDTDALALIARMDAVSGFPPDATKSLLIDDTIKRLKSAGLWAKMDVLNLYANYSAQASLVNWIKNAHTITLSATPPTFTVDRGWLGGALKEMVFDYNPSTAGINYLLDSASFGVYSRTAGMTAERQIQCLHANMYATYTDGKAYSRVNAALDTTYLNPGGGAAMYIATRNSAIQQEFYKNNIQTTAAIASTTVPNSNFSVLFPGCANEIAFSFMGGGLSAADVTLMNTIIVDGYLASVGAKI